ncbi:hypothetical protein HMPREF1551_02394 [Capnocytophaga sp. oral taxon 863 str. F0517]|uniref:hypothetical protein n=1 Tax=Capnocytophaga sp. oral taxon 863 TaxID=1227265 RepID=UPI0003970242|nr:hypothetical protein [Capnocytophaga sp. oral taxon 863]ERI61715.1 hypothetical protein HMPREF1551_02394 [Capnocytophaga sp. oral taxon 863 str. F0517]
MKQCICNQLTDIVEGESIKNFQSKIAYKEIALEVMGISYAKGGDYCSETIKSFAEGYLKTVEI